MINKKAVKEIVNKEFNKKIGKSALEKISQMAKEHILDILKKASRRADISGRIVLKEEDFI